MMQADQIVMGLETPAVTVFGSSGDGNFYRIPALVYQNSWFLAFSEKRIGGRQDWRPMEMVLRRGHLEEDNNVSWGNETTLYRSPSVRPMNPVPIVGENHIVLMFNTYPVDKKESEIKKSKPKHAKDALWPLWHLMMIRSDDGGKTWDPPKEIRVKDLFSQEIPSSCAIGPGHGIQLESGRLVVPGHVIWQEKSKTHYKNLRNFVIITDDEGSTWKMGDYIPPAKTKYMSTRIKGNECQVVDMGSGNVVITCRTEGTYPRIQCYGLSKESSIEFGESEGMQVLIGPNNGCQGSIFGFKQLKNDGNMMWALFSNPANKYSRKKLTVRLSKDGCKNWGVKSPDLLVLEEGGAEYSDLTGFIQNGQQKFACLYECTADSSKPIKFVKFTMA